MVDWFGSWKAESDYSKFPKEKWCDCDYVAAWIADSNYKSEAPIEILVRTILLYYSGYLIENNADFYTDRTESENGMMISIEDVSCFVEEDGGLKEFDSRCLWCGC